MIDIQHDGAATGEENMERDLALYDAVRRGKTNVAFRTYEWKPWAVSLGKHQQTDKLSVNKIQDRGYDLVWRPTGGRAVLHAEELTYCIAIRTTQPQLVYEQVHEFLRKQLTSITRYLDYEHQPTDIRSHYLSNSVLGQVCFTSSARTELMAKNRKVVGSAQRVFDDVVLQHGSILIGDAHAGIAEFLAENVTQERTLHRRIMQSSISLSELTQRTVTADEVRTAIGTTFDIQLMHTDLNTESQTDTTENG